MKDANWSIKHRKRKKVAAFYDANHKIDLTLEPIYHNTDSWWDLTGNMEIGEGYWVRAEKSYESSHRFITLYHRHMNGKSVSRGVDVDSQCATCREYVPEWVKGAMNLIVWSMDEHDAD